MFGYVNTLRGMSQGRAQFTMQYDHYRAVEQEGDPDPSFPVAAAMRA
jgi:translation elongation factor EF-G